MFTILADEVSTNTSIWIAVITAGSTLLGVVLTLLIQSKAFRKNAIIGAEIDMKKSYRTNTEKAYAEVIAAAKDFDHIVYEFFQAISALKGDISKGISVNGFKFDNVNTFFAHKVANPYNKYLNIYKDNFLYLGNVSIQVESVTNHIHELHNLAITLARNSFKVSKKDNDDLDKVTELFKKSFNELLDATRSDLNSFKIQ